LVILAGIGGALAHVPPVSAWVERTRARIETDADAHAIAAGSTRRAIARAVLKLEDPSGTIAATAFVSAADLRLRALLGEEATRPTRWAEDVGLAMALAVGVLVVCLALAP
jgi:hypothetical protein